MKMNSPASPPRTRTSTAADEAEVIAASRRWIERVVIGLNLCPFARAPFVHDRLRLRVSSANDVEALVVDLRDELEALQAADPQVCETTLLIHPYVLSDFVDYNNFLDRADSTIESLGLQSEIQIASFHPDYQFADADIDAVENHTNRSPHPMLHLLRESSVARAVASIADPSDITRRNVDTLRRIGIAGLRAQMVTASSSEEKAGPDGPFEDV